MLLQALLTSGELEQLPSRSIPRFKVQTRPRSASEDVCEYIVGKKPLIISCAPGNGTQGKRAYRAWQKNGSQVARIFQARPGRSGKQQQEQNSRNLGTVFLPGPVLSIL